MSKTEQTWCVSSSGGSRRRAEKIKNSCWYESRKNVSGMAVLLVTIFLCKLICLKVCSGFSISLQHFVLFFRLLLSKTK